MFRERSEKLEVVLKEPYNPIMQDTVKSTKEKKLRFLGLPPKFNYGMLPQTWENPDILNPKTQLYGDNDPLDICELGTNEIKTGTVVKRRILDSLCVSDQELGEATD